jgi:Ca-activated chloride channel family protein
MKMKLDYRFDHAVVPPGAPGIVHILMTLCAPSTTNAHKRPDLNIAAVIDRSGSMSGEPLEYAKQAVSVLLDQLGPRDRFSLVAFDDDVLPLVAGSDEVDKTHLKSIVGTIEPRGSTNLSGGWIKGIELVGQGAKDGDVNAVLLLTDGGANVGITDSDKLTGLGKGVNDEQSIRTTCLGMGAHFDEDVLRDIAAASGGRFHYIESPDHAPEVFREELGGLLTVTAQNVEVVLKFADGVSGVAQLTEHPSKQNANTSHFVLGDFSDSQVKHVLLAVELPALTDVDDMLIASLELTYAEVETESIQIKKQSQDLVVRVGGDDIADEPADPEVLLHLGIQQAAQARRDAVKQIDEGDFDGAKLTLDLSKKGLREYARQVSDPSLLDAEAAELQKRADELCEMDNVADSRKFMVAEASGMSSANYSNVQASRTRRKR